MIGRAGDRNELRRIAAIERQVDDALLIDDLGDRVLLRLHHAGVGVYLDLLRHCTHPHGDVDLDVVVDSEKDAVLDVGLKSGDRRLKRVGADGQAWEGVDAVGVGDGIVDRAGIDAGDFDLGAGSPAHPARL